MKFSERTVSVLKNFSLINTSLLFKKGSQLATISSGKSILAIAKVVEKFPQDFAIYDLSRFLGVLSLFESPEIKFEKDWLTAGANGSSVKYIYASPEMIESPTKTNIDVDKFEINLSLSEKNLSSLMKASAMMQLPDVAVIGDGKKMVISALSVENPTGDEYTIDIGNSIKNKFKMVFKVENMKLLSDEYKVEISSKGIGRFTSKDLVYWVPFYQKGSTFEA